MQEKASVKLAAVVGAAYVFDVARGGRGPVFALALVVLATAAARENRRRRRRR